jgi:hypothetical protein
MGSVSRGNAKPRFASDGIAASLFDGEGLAMNCKRGSDALV